MNICLWILVHEKNVILCLRVLLREHAKGGTETPLENQTPILIQSNEVLLTSTESCFIMTTIYPSMKNYFIFSFQTSTWANTKASLAISKHSYPFASVY